MYWYTNIVIVHVLYMFSCVYVIYSYIWVTRVYYTLLLHTILRFILRLYILYTTHTSFLIHYTYFSYLVYRVLGVYAILYVHTPSLICYILTIHMYTPYTHTPRCCIRCCCRVETKIKEFKYIPETLAANKDLRKLYTNNNAATIVFMYYTVYVLCIRWSVNLYAYHAIMLFMSCNCS